MAGMDNALHLVGIARRGGRLEVGEEPVGAAARARKARLLVLAADAAGNTLRRASHFAQAGQVLLLQSQFSKAELGLATGRGSCAMLAFTDAGLAAAFAKKLAARDPAAYSESAQALDIQARRVLERQKEQRRHEKKLQRAKTRPWAPPPRADIPSAGAGHRSDAKGRMPSSPGHNRKFHRPRPGTKRGGGRQVT